MRKNTLVILFQPITSSFRSSNVIWRGNLWWRRKIGSSATTTVTKTSLASSFIAPIPSRSIRQMLEHFSGIEFWDCIKVQGGKRKKKVVLLRSRPPQSEQLSTFTFLVVQRRQRNVNKSMMHVQSSTYCFFAVLVAPSPFLRLPNVGGSLMLSVLQYITWEMLKSSFYPLCTKCFLTSILVFQVDIEKANPHSVERECGEYVLHLWSHSLYVLACLLNEV